MSVCPLLLWRLKWLPCLIQDPSLASLHPLCLVSSVRCCALHNNLPSELSLSLSLSHPLSLSLAVSQVLLIFLQLDFTVLSILPSIPSIWTSLILPHSTPLSNSLSFLSLLRLSSPLFSSSLLYTYYFSLCQSPSLFMPRYY